MENDRGTQSKADELEDRLIAFAVRIIKLSASLPNTPAGKHIAGQILRSGTSPAPNYGEARGAESHANFVHKVRIVLKELNETSIWLRIIERGELLRKELSSPSSPKRTTNCAASSLLRLKLRAPSDEHFQFSFIIVHCGDLTNDK